MFANLLQAWLLCQEFFFNRVAEPDWQPLRTRADVLSAVAGTA